LSCTRVWVDAARHADRTPDPAAPYGPLLLGLSDGHAADRAPTGPLVGALLDVHQGWVADMGLAGPDAGHGATFLVVPPEWQGQAPDDVVLCRSTTYRLTGGVRALPLDGDMKAATELVTTVRVRPLEAQEDTSGATWVDLTGVPHSTESARRS
jgi:hypothetical protein